MIIDKSVWRCRWWAATYRTLDEQRPSKTSLCPYF